MFWLRRLALVLWISAVVLGTRYIFGDTQSFGDRQYLEYITPYFAYASLIHAFVLCVFYREARGLLKTRRLAQYLLITVSGVMASPNLAVSVWWLTVLTLWIWSVATLALVLLHDKKLQTIFFAALIFAGIVEASLAITQFALQHSLGLSLLGEPIANTNTLGVAKVLLKGEKLLRPFGTFPHSNVLAGFLVCSSLALLSQKTRIFTRYPLLFHLSLGIITVGVVLSYSRAGWLALVLLLVYFAVQIGLKHLLPTIAIAVTTLTLFATATTSRFELRLQEQQIDVRTVSIEIAHVSLRDFPLGLGIRGFIPFMLERRPDLPVFYYQPPHIAGLFLIAELGIPAFVVLLIIALWLLARVRQSSLSWLAVTILLVLSLFDHYLVSLIQGLGIFGLLLILIAVLRRTDSPIRLLRNSI